MYRFAKALYAQGTYPLVMLLIMAIAGAAVVFPLSFVTRTNVLIGLLLFPISLFFTGKRRVNHIYFFLCAASAAMAIGYGVRMFYFFMLIFVLLFFLEMCIGRLNGIVIFLTVLMSPFFDQVAVILGFSLRLKISALAGASLTALGMPVEVNGNALQLDGSTFTVDQACAGLNMLSLSLLMGAFLLVYRYRVHHRFLSIHALTLYFVAGLILNVIANLFRIVILVIFKVLPGNPMHDIMGVIIFVGYVVVPLYFLSDFFVRRYGRIVPPVSVAPRWSAAYTAMLVCAVVMIMGSAWSVRERRAQPGVAHATVHFTPATNGDFTTEKIRDGITRISGDEFLIYVKPIAEFFSGEHTPLLCWRGSGYKFGEVREVIAGETPILVGTLEKNDEQLFTAWWYANGSHTTISQADWRYRMLRGEGRFCLVNVTASDQETLMQKVIAMCNDNELVIMP